MSTEAINATGTSPDDAVPRADDVRGILRGRRAYFESITLAQVQEVNDARMRRWHIGGRREWSVLEWAGAMCGEAGEAANVAKKLLRIELDLDGNESAEHPLTDFEELKTKLAGEIGGVVLYAALLATNMGIDFEEAVRDTFNVKSQAMGFPERL